MVRGQGCLNLDWFGLWLVLFAPAVGDVCAFIAVLALFWAHLHLIQLVSLVENFLLKEFFSSFPGRSTGLIEVKLFSVVTCVLVCDAVLWDYCWYLQVARNDKTNEFLCDNSDNEFDTACRIIFLGVEDRCTF